MAQHLGARVRAGRIDFVQHGHSAVTDTRADQKDRHVAAAEVWQLFARVEEFRGAAILAGEEVRERHRQHVEDLLERRDRGTDAVLLDLRDEPVGNPGLLGERALRQTLCQTAFLEPLADVDMQCRMSSHAGIIPKAPQAGHRCARRAFDFLNARD